MQSMYPGELALHLTTVILSTVAAVCALYLIPLSGKAKAWLLLCAAFVLLSVERLSELMSHANMLLDTHTQEVISDALLAVVSVCLIGGVCYIRTVFILRNGERHKLEQQLDELQRFHQVTIGRELRMKELYDENQALKAQIKEQKK